MFAKLKNESTAVYHIICDLVFGFHSILYQQIFAKKNSTTTITRPSFHLYYFCVCNYFLVHFFISLDNRSFIPCYEI